MQSLAMLYALTKKEGIEHVIQLTLDAPFVITKENEAARRKIRKIYLKNRDVFESGFPLYTFWQPTRPLQASVSPRSKLQRLLSAAIETTRSTTLTDKISNGIRNSRTQIIPGGTRFLHLDKPKEFNRLVLEFLPWRVYLRLVRL